jgi:hypothetical protein
VAPHKFSSEQTRRSQCVSLIPLLLGALIVSSDSARTTDQAESSSRNLLVGKPAMGDWTTDAPGLRSQITIADLPSPFATESANNGPHVVERPADAQLHVPSGFKVQEYASGLRNPRFLLTAADMKALSPASSRPKATFGDAPSASPFPKTAVCYGK